MEADEIVRALTWIEDLPRETLEAASARRGEMVQVSLAEVDRFLVDRI